MSSPLNIIFDQPRYQLISVLRSSSLANSLPPIRLCNYNDLLVYEYFVIRIFLSRKKFTRFELNFATDH